MLSDFLGETKVPQAQHCLQGHPHAAAGVASDASQNGPNSSGGPPGHSNQAVVALSALSEGGQRP